MAPSGENVSGQTVTTAAPPFSANDIDPALLSSPGDIDPDLFSSPDAPSTGRQDKGKGKDKGRDKGKGKAPVVQQIPPSRAARAGPSSSSSNTATTQDIGQGEAGPSTAFRRVARPRGMLNRAIALGLVDASAASGQSQGQASSRELFRFSHAWVLRFRQHIREGFLGTTQAAVL